MAAERDDGELAPWRLLRASAQEIGGEEEPPVSHGPSEGWEPSEGLELDLFECDEPRSLLGSSGGVGDLEQDPNIDFDWADPDEEGWYEAARDHAEPRFEEPDAPDAPPETASSHDEVARPALRDEAFARLAAESSFKRMRVDRPRQSWEDNPVFGGSAFKSSLSSWLSMTPSVGVRETLSPEPAVSFGGEDAAAIPWTISRRLNRIRVVRSEEDERNHALKKLKALTLLDPLATALGESLVQKTGALEDDDTIASSFCDAFSSKASGTLTKRAGSLQKLVVQLYKQGVESPWRMSEADLYSALKALRDEGCGATAPAHVLEALHFLHAVACFKCINLDSVISARCKGLAHTSYLKKAPLVQRDSLKCRQVRALERKMVDSGPVERCILGQVLFCIHAVCRWRDSQRLRAVEVLGHGESQLLFGDALGSKTSLSKESQTRFVPHVALAQGLTECSWGRLWLAAREECGLEFGAGPDGHALPTRSLRLDKWGSTRMGAAEASAWIQEWLSETEATQNLGTHSLKVTVLTWASRSTLVKLSKGERLLLGHHVQAGVKSMLTYSREAYTSLAGKVLALYRSIRRGDFDPDLDPAARVLQVADALVDDEGDQGAEYPAPGEPEAQDDGDDDEDSGVPGSEREDAALFELGEGFMAIRAPFEGVDVSACRIHVVSGIAHCLKGEGDTFWCGRVNSGRYTRYSGVGAEDPDVCLQCSRTRGE